MLRNEWEFSYTTRQLLEAASGQYDFRDGRVKFWEAQKADVIQRIRDSGINVNESLVDKMGNTAKYLSSGHRGPRIEVDASMQEDLDECFRKIQHHTELRKQYKAWVDILSAQQSGDAAYALTLDDWMFFFGK